MVYVEARRQQGREGEVTNIVRVARPVADCEIVIPTASIFEAIDVAADYGDAGAVFRLSDDGFWTGKAVVVIECAGPRVPEWRSHTCQRVDSVGIDGGAGWIIVCPFIASAIHRTCGIRIGCAPAETIGEWASCIVADHHVGSANERS